MIPNYQGFPCPKCGGKMASKQTARANEGRFMLRNRTCVECGYRNVTVEYAPDALAGFMDLRRFDPDQLLARRLRDRERFGYHGIDCAHPKAPLTLSIRDPSVKIRGGQYLCNHEHGEEVA